MSIQTNEFTYTDSELRQSHRLRAAIILVIILLIPFAGSLAIGTIPGVPRSLIFGAAVLLMIAISFIYQFFFSARKASADPRPRCFEFDQDTITATFEDGTSTPMNLADMRVVVVNQGQISLYIDPKTYWLIPWRVFQSPDDTDHLEAALRAHEVPIVNRHPR